MPVRANIISDKKYTKIKLKRNKYLISIFWLFLKFKKKYPEDKFDDDTVFDVWQSLTDADKQLAVGVMEYQNNGWVDIDRKYIPKASNYLLKEKFKEVSVCEPYKSEIRREKDKIKQREYYQKADQDSATPEEIKAILKQFKDAGFRLNPLQALD